MARVPARKPAPAPTQPGLPPQATGGRLQPYTGRCFFIVGCARSGTTLLRVMLNRHSRIAIPTESLFIADYLRCRRQLGPESMRRLLVREYEVGEWGLRPTPAELGVWDSVPGLLGGLHELYAQRAGKSIWGQKTPRLVRHLASLAEAFPAARFVHIVRDPRAVVWSLMRSPVHRGNALYGSRRWSLDVGAARRFAAASAGRMLEIGYERLLAEPEATLRQVCRHLGIDFEPALLAADPPGEDEYEAGFYGDVHRLIHRAPDPSRVDAWRSGLSAEDLAVVEAICGQQMMDYGYRRELGSRPRRPAARLLRLRLGRLTGAARQVLFYLRHRPGYLASTVRRKLRLGLARDLVATLRRFNY